jgi:hypothetical protein
MWDGLDLGVVAGWFWERYQALTWVKILKMRN